MASETSTKRPASDMVTGSSSLVPDDATALGPSAASSSPSQPPQEDWRAWMQVLGAFCINLNTWGMMNSYGVFQTYYQLHLLHGHSASNIAWIGSTQAFLLFVVSVAVGALFDAGFAHTLLWGGGIMVVAGVMLLSVASLYWHVFLSQAIMVGLGFGLLYLVAPAIVSQYFGRRTALAMGASSAGSAIGGAVFPIAFSRLVERLDFGWACRILGFILLVTSAIPGLLMRSKEPPQRDRKLFDATALRDVPYLLLNAGLTFGFMGLYIVFYYIELLARDRAHVSDSLARYLLVIINLSSLPGRIIPGYYADKVGSINVQTAVALLSAMLTIFLCAIRSAAGLVVFCAIYGFFSGAFMGLPAAGIVRLSDDKSKIGIRIGMTLGTVGFGVLISNPIAGAIVYPGKDWVGLISWCGALLFASGFCLVASRVSKVGWGLKTVI
ncbi:Major facilitator superfamily domain, general substrate transporter [Cordyceps fumosorosea ARSEF 2679]|uniref:Major facilitator superfamily domain, general substrate transporter n=1 Tax=Cordyceps fumosorosea (strain ARSEF 2679) TaxID=1081104 RepID=A0A166ZLA4_CORFA|nr:Major facilitator superfamily domain, general substrate transporter [Cordyceps fumosorosea ARSEF 2679]OAA38035.1 Major facilitator superfamily domain, general substrate transporter [Cordyceps fumosorosea ARSEF 2679]